MVKATRSPVSGQILVPNAGAHTGCYYADGTLPEERTIEWTTVPSFVELVEATAGQTVTIRHGVTDPADTTITAELGTGTTAATFVRHLDLGDGLTGVVPSSLVGSVMTMRVTAELDGYPTKTIVVSSGVVIRADPAHAAFPPDIAAADWTSIEVRSAISASGKRRATLSGSVVVPDGFELRWNSGPTAGGVGNDGSTVKMNPGDTYTTTGQMLIGQTCYNNFFWKRLSDGAYQRAHPLSEQVVFTILGLIIIDPGGQFPAANQTVSNAAALMAAVNTRIASGSTADWIVDLANGDYGSLSFADKILPGRFIIRSQDRAGLGAKIRTMNLTRASRIHFQCIDFTLQGMGYVGTVFDCTSSKNLDFSYNRFFAPAQARNPVGGYFNAARRGFNLTHENGDRPTNIRFHMNEFNWPVGEQIYMNACDNVEISHNVSSSTGGDFIILGTNRDFDISRNWGPRYHYPTYNPSNNDYHHSDFVQVDSRLGTSERIVHTGNVLIAGKNPGTAGITRQGLFGSKCFARDHIYRANYICTNSNQGIWLGPAAQQSGRHIVENNTVLRIIDMSSAHVGTYIWVEGSGVTSARNIQHHTNNGMGGVRNIPIIGGNYTGSLAYYTSPVAEISPGVMSSFYDHRPVEGTLAHWNYSGGPAEGAAERFREVIVDGLYPKIGPAAAAWKAWYDPRGQIAA